MIDSRKHLEEGILFIAKRNKSTWTFDNHINRATAYDEGSWRNCGTHANRGKHPTSLCNICGCLFTAIPFLCWRGLKWHSYFTSIIVIMLIFIIIIIMIIIVIIIVIIRIIITSIMFVSYSLNHNSLACCLSFKLARLKCNTNQHLDREPYKSGSLKSMYE